jgi:DNA processing protein
MLYNFAITMKKEELLARLALLEIDGLGPVGCHALLAKFGNAVDIFSASKKQLNMVYRLSHRAMNSIQHASLAFQKAEKEALFIEKNDVKVYHSDHKGYPMKLAQCADAPHILFGIGNFPENETRTVGIVGTRNMTHYGKQIVKELVSELQKSSCWIISGLALGVDTEAHIQSLENSIATLGVMGTGIDHIYPWQNKKLVSEILEKNGGIITEFMSGTKPDRENFPRRNRVVAGMVDVLVVIEASKTGGALITAELANSYHREVMAYPGRITDEYSVGCNELIKQGKAILIHQPEDLLKWMGWNFPEQQMQLFSHSPLLPEEAMIVNALSKTSSMHLDELVNETNIPIFQIKGILLNLELNNHIRTYPGGRWGKR